MRPSSEGPRVREGKLSVQRTRATAAEPGFVVLVNEGTPVGSEAEIVRFGPSERQAPHQPARAVAAVAAAAVLASGALLLVRHSDGHSSSPLAASTPTRSSSFIFDPGFGGGTRARGTSTNGRPAPSPTPPATVRVTFASGQSVPGPVPLPEAQAVGVRVGPLAVKYRHHDTVVAGPAALAKTLVAGHTYTVTFRYYAALDISETSTGHVAPPFGAQMRCPPDFRIRPGHSYTVQCRVRPEPGTDSIAFTVTDEAHAKWEAGTSVLLVAR